MRTTSEKTGVMCQLFQSVAKIFRKTTKYKCLEKYFSKKACKKKINLV
jgi:hypothetical protein